ncbi:uncharacterized protein [Procambarus clarkii]|uniref:uncharacterized protein n=1 Tax=Procambarus clarkii TaxID=6728 RepID=UPI0037431A81
MVEHFHRQLKSTLRAQACPDDWTDHLPLVLLGIRSAMKEGSGFSVADLVYGSSLELPGEFLTPTPLITPPDPTFVQKLWAAMTNIRPTPPRQPTTRATYVPRELHTTEHVFVRIDAVRRPLQSPYERPFRVVSRTPKFFTIERRGQRGNISSDRLKPAHCEAAPDIPPETHPPTTPFTFQPQLPAAPPATTMDDPVRPPILQPQLPAAPPPDSTTTDDPVRPPTLRLQLDDISKEEDVNFEGYTKRAGRTIHRPARFLDQLVLKAAVDLSLSHATLGHTCCSKYQTTPSHLYLSVHYYS